MDMERFVYLCMMFVTKKCLKNQKNCLIPKDNFMDLSNHIEVWMFLQENCPNLWKKIKDSIKYASYYNVDGKICACMSVPTDGIPAKDANQTPIQQNMKQKLISPQF